MFLMADASCTWGEILERHGFWRTTQPTRRGVDSELEHLSGRPSQSGSEVVVGPLLLVP